MRENFIDFTMAADDITDSYELARGRNHLPPGVSFMDQTTDVFSIGAPSPRGGNDGRRRSTGRKDDKRRNRNSSEEAGDLGAGRIPRKTRVQPHDRSLGSPMPRISSFADLNFDEATSTPKRGKSRISNGSGDRPAKITDHVSSTGSGGSRASRLVNPTITPRDRDSEEDALSDLGNTGRQWFGNTRFQHSVPARGRRLSEDLTGDVPAIVARQRKPQAEAIPKGFKSTNDFLKELGLDGHTQTINLQNSLKELKDVGTPVRIRPRNTPQNPARNLNLDPSFMIPHMADMTDLFSGNEVTRFSAKKGAAAKSHVPIGSIPIPHETRAMLTAMKLLQEKVANLEGDKVTTEQKCSKLEAELRRAELKYQQETRRARLSEEELRRRGRTAFPVSDNEDMERTRTDFIMEKMGMRNRSLEAGYCR